MSSEKEASYGQAENHGNLDVLHWQSRDEIQLRKPLTMRFNVKEMACIAKESSHKFDKEGYLGMKQKYDRPFKRGEVFTNRFFRLRGNLLFYFKKRDLKADPLGVFVLERCTVELDIFENTNFCFLLVFEGEEPTYTFCTQTEEDRDSWIQALHISSYECLKMQLQSLREQVQAKTGRDPMLTIMPSDTGMEFETTAGMSAEEPAMEISIAMEGLPDDSTGQAPNPFVVIYTIVPPQQQTWLQHNHTEMVEKNNNPHFLKTIGFGDSNGLEPSTRVKVTVYHVKERMTGTMIQTGQVIFTLNDILMSENMSLNLSLSGIDQKKIGDISLVAWLNESVGPVVDMQSDGDVFHESTQRLTQRNIPKRRSKRLDTLKHICDKIVTRTFRFETNEAVKLLVYEYMAESKFTFELPIKILKLLIEEEKKRISQIQDLGQLPELQNLVAEDISYRKAVVMDYADELPSLWRNACQEYMDICLSTISTYTQHMKFLLSYKGSSFKPSSKKTERELEFVPVNLHLQRMTVLNESTEACGCYDTITCGAFVAHARKNRSGLMKLLQQQQDSYTPEGTLSKVSKVKKACDLVNGLYELQIEIVKLCDRVCHEALQGDSETLLKAKDDLAEKVKELVLECENSILQDTATKLEELHEEYEAQAEQAAEKNKASNFPAIDKSPDKPWRWTGSCFVKSPTVEPWDMTRVNTEAALVCLTSMVEDLVKNKAGAMDRPKWLGDISPAVIKLKSFVEIICLRASHFMSFLDLIEHKNNLRTMHEVKCRRDVVFSQALTTLVTGFVCHINAHIDDPTVLNQLVKTGVVMEMEGLLSCHGEDVNYLEDMIIAIDDLSVVSFRLIQETPQRQSVELTTTDFKKSGTYPDLNRHHVCVEVPMKKHHFEKLPARLQTGDVVKVVPAFFNIGINEQATLAERFGSTGLQDRVNEESLGRLFRYVQQYEELPEYKSLNKSGAGTIPDLMQQLHYNVYTKRSKNVEILRIAAELCRKLNGLRFTCCKSGKDRTAMSCTLEQVNILQQEHELASHAFMQSLDCFRSEGCRRENVFKNIGQRKYAFNSLQLLSFPKQYRPPNGTYGNVQN